MARGKCSICGVWRSNLYKCGECQALLCGCCSYKGIIAEQYFPTKRFCCYPGQPQKCSEVALDKLRDAERVAMQIPREPNPVDPFDEPPPLTWKSLTKLHPEKRKL